jgi:hypothetical protein
MSQVVQSRRLGHASADVGGVDELPKCQLHDGVRQPLAVQGREEAGSAASGWSWSRS